MSVTRPQVLLRVPPAPAVAVAPGGIVGRLQAASLRVPDPRVPEAAALVSLRGRELHLLALRGGLEVDGAPEDEVLLVEGLVVRLAGVVDLEVGRVDLPERVLALALPGQLRELCAPVYSLVLDPEPDLVPTYVEGAAARVWSTAEGWTGDFGRGPEAVKAGRAWDVAGVHLEAREVALGEVGSAATTGRLEPLTIVARTTSVHIQRPRRPPVTLDGLPALLLSELATMGAPAPWTVVAGELWGKRDPARHRMSWDRALRRLRTRLREAGIRDDLVRADGRGNVEVFLHPGDRVVDEA